MADILMGVTETSAAAIDVISKQVQTYLQQASKMVGTVDNHSNLVIPGSKSVGIPNAGSFSVNDKSENTAISSQALTYTLDQLLLDKHKVIQWLLEDIANEQTVISVVQDALMRAGKDIARQVDQDIINILETASAAAPDHRIAYVGADIAEVDILEGRRLMRAQFINPNECKLGINSTSEKAMLQIANFIDASKYGAGTPISNGEIGRVFGMPVIVHEDIESLKSLIWHPSAMGYAAQFGPRFQSESDLPNLATRYSLDMLYGVKLKDSGKRCVMLGTAA